MSTQTMATTTETITCVITMGGGGKDPLPPQSSSNPQHIRDTFDIALGQAFRDPRGPRGAGGPGGPCSPCSPGGPGDHAVDIPATHLISIPHRADLKPAGMPAQVFNKDRMQAEAFMRELRLYMMANHGVPGFKSPIRRIMIALTFIKGPQVNGQVEGIL
jgi:hypothetical protein